MESTNVEDLVVEDGEVEGESQSDRVSRRKFSRSDRRSGLVCREWVNQVNNESTCSTNSRTSFERRLGGGGSSSTGSEFSEVSVVISLHLVVEDLNKPSHESPLVSSPSARRGSTYLGLSRLGGLDEVIVEDFEDVFTNWRRVVMVRFRSGSAKRDENVLPANSASIFSRYALMAVT